MQICVFPQIIPKACRPLHMRILVRAASEDADRCPSRQPLGHLLRSHLADAIVIRANIGDPRQFFIDGQQRDTVLLRLFHPLRRMVDVDRRDDECIDAFLQKILDDLILFAIGSFIFWRHDDQADVILLGGLLHAGPHSQPMLTVHRLEHDADRISRAAHLFLRILQGQEDDSRADEQCQKDNCHRTHQNAPFHLHFNLILNRGLRLPARTDCVIRAGAAWLP